MSATIIPFRQRPPKPANRPSDPYDALFLEFVAHIEARRERMRDPEPLPGEPSYGQQRPQPRKGDLIRMVKERAKVRRAARRPPEEAR